MSTAPEQALALRYSALSDLGRYRKDNQDSGYASEHLLVIADGVGGAAYGDVASSTAVHILRRLDEPPPEDLLTALAGAIHRAHDRLAEMVEADPELDGTSTTITAALFDGTRVGMAHVGDSRAYLLRDGALTQLTKDHTFVQTLVDEGRITEEESRTHPHRNLILRAVDGVHDTEPDLFHVDLHAGDRLLLCSDGCSGVLPDDRLGQVLGDGTVDFAAVELVRAALDAGTTDNVTVIVADVVAAGTEHADDDELASAATGPMLVGAAAHQPRRGGAAVRGFFRGHRSGDTGEMDPVPAEPGEDPVDPEELRYAPRPPRRRVWLRRGVVLVLLAALVGWLAKLGYDWTQEQYYVADEGPYVAIYRGVQADIPGITLSSVEEVSAVTLAALPEYNAEQVRSGMDARDLDDAQDIVTRLRGLAVPCPTEQTRPRKDRSPSRSPRPTGTRSPSSTPTRTPSSSPTGGSADPDLAPPDCLEATTSASSSPSSSSSSSSSGGAS